MPSIVGLPIRANAITFDEDTVRDVADLLDEVEKGQGVGLDPEDTEGKARTRARIMVEALRTNHDIDARTHVLDNGNGTFTPVVSRKPSK